MVHPFTLDENLDENLELFFGLSIPFIDFRIGIQGAGEAFSFIINRDDRESSLKGFTKVYQIEDSLKMLHLSKIKSDLRKFKKDSGSVKRHGEL